MFAWPLTLVMVAVLPTVIAAGPRPQAKSPAVATVKTEKGIFRVPGSAFLDGRDFEAQPPLTVMDIRVWNAPVRTRKVCSLPHGTAVDVLEAERSAREERYYFRVRANGCEGWLPETFIATKKHRPIGDPYR